MADNNFDLKGFLNDPKVQANKPAAIRYLQQKGIIDAQGNIISQVKPQKTGVLQNLKDFGIGFLKGAGRSLVDLVNGATKTEPTLLGIGPFGIKTPNIEKPKILENKNTSQRVGGYAEFVTEVAAPFAAEKVRDVAALATKRVAIGKEAIDLLEKIGDKEAKNFVPIESGGKGKQFSEVVTKVEGAISKFEKDSMAELKAVKDAIPNTKPTSAVAKGIKDTITNLFSKSASEAITKNAVYKGMDPENIIVKGIKDLKDFGLLDDQEIKKIDGMTKYIKNWKDWSARGLLNLKEQLGVFYKDGLDNSNAILRQMQRGLKDVVGEIHPPIKAALEKASQNIDSAENFSRNLIGRDSVSGESKLQSIAKALKNPAANGEKIKELVDLAKKTGYNALPELKGYSRYLDLLAKDFPTKAGTVAKSLAKRVGITAGVGVGAEEIKRLFGF